MAGLPEQDASKPVDQQALDWKRWLGSAPDQAFSEEKLHYWRWFWNFGGGAMTDLFTHWIDVVHWAMNSDQPRQAQIIADKYVFEQWDCPDTIQAAFRYPGFDVVYEGMMASSVDDGGLEFRGTEATLKINRDGFAVYRENMGMGKILSLANAVPRTARFHIWRISSTVSRRANSPMPRSKPALPPPVPDRSATWPITRGDKWRGRPKAEDERFRQLFQRWVPDRTH